MKEWKTLEETFEDIKGLNLQLNKLIGFSSGIKIGNISAIVLKFTDRELVIESKDPSVNVKYTDAVDRSLCIKECKESIYSVQHSFKPIKVTTYVEFDYSTDETYKLLLTLTDIKQDTLITVVIEEGADFDVSLSLIEHHNLYNVISPPPVIKQYGIGNEGAIEINGESIPCSIVVTPDWLNIEYKTHNSITPPSETLNNIFTFGGTPDQTCKGRSTDIERVSEDEVKTMITQEPIGYMQSLPLQTIENMLDYEGINNDDVLYYFDTFKKTRDINDLRCMFVEQCNDIYGNIWVAIRDISKQSEVEIAEEECMNKSLRYYTKYKEGLTDRPFGRLFLYYLLRLIYIVEGEE